MLLITSNQPPAPKVVREENLLASTQIEVRRFSYIQYFTILCEIAERASSDAACSVYPASEDAYSASKS
jgi:hypothetical protein